MQKYFINIICTGLFLLSINAQSTLNSAFPGKWGLNKEKSVFPSTQGMRHGGMRGQRMNNDDGEFRNRMGRERPERITGRQVIQQPYKMSIQLNGNNLVIESFIKNKEGEEFLSKKEYKIDGEENYFASEMEETVTVVILTEDGKINIKSQTVINRNDEILKTTTEEVWQIEDDLLIINTVIENLRGKFETKSVYEKEK